MMIIIVSAGEPLGGFSTAKMSSFYSEVEAAALAELERVQGYQPEPPLFAVESSSESEEELPGPSHAAAGTGAAALEVKEAEKGLQAQEEVSETRAVS